MNRPDFTLQQDAKNVTSDLLYGILHDEKAVFYSPGDRKPQQTSQPSRSPFYEIPKGQDRSPTPEVLEMGAIQKSMTGNLVPAIWTHKLRLPGGNADAVSALVLAEIVKWYKPTITFTPDGNEVAKRKFIGDFLQKSVNDFAKELGFSKEQIRDALNRLKDAGLIIKHLRTISVHGVKSSNVLFIQLCTARLASLNAHAPYSDQSDELWGIIPRAVGTEAYTSTDPSPNKYSNDPARTHREEKNKSLRFSDFLKPEEATYGDNEPHERASSNFADLPESLPAPSAQTENIIEEIELAFDGDQLTAKQQARIEKLVAAGQLDQPFAKALQATRKIWLADPKSWKGIAFIPFSPKCLLDKLNLSKQGVYTVLKAAVETATSKGKPEGVRLAQMLNAMKPPCEVSPDDLDVASRAAEIAIEEAQVAANYSVQKYDPEDEINYQLKQIIGYCSKDSGGRELGDPDFMDTMLLYCTPGSAVMKCLLAFNHPEYRDKAMEQYGKDVQKELLDAPLFSEAALKFGLPIQAVKDYVLPK
jgi:hypothetical protein